MIGSNPLRGPNPAELGGPRFLDLSAPYDAQYSSILHSAAAELGLPQLREGVYIGVRWGLYAARRLQPLRYVCWTKWRILSSQH